MKRIVVFGLLFLVCAFVVSATAPEITVNSLKYKDRFGSNIATPENTGDQIIAKITVKDTDGFRDIRRTELTWGTNSWVDCSRLNVFPQKIRYSCILTVTPFMNTLTDVNIKVTASDNSEYIQLLGTYDFKGEQFPDTNPTSSIDFSKINFIGSDADIIRVNGDEVEKRSFRLSVSYKDNGWSKSSLSLYTQNKDKYTYKLGQPDSITNDGTTLTMSYYDAEVKYRLREEVCKTYSSGRVRCRNKYNSGTTTDDVVITITSSSIDFEGNIVDAIGVEGKVTKCSKVSGRTECISYKVA
ncbi:MAG: hypothetical protein KKB31_01465 [Nanoarchaeota archaeon]|nr:hypothetical protein [Nanoarchaeota archaeon]